MQVDRSENEQGVQQQSTVREVTIKFESAQAEPKWNGSDSDLPG
jgi:hypothetical protein